MTDDLTYPNGLTASWTYGNRGELLEVDNALSDGSVSKYVYTYDAAGRRLGCDKSGSAFDTPDANSYRYNARSELTNATAAIDAAYNYGYDFDDIGNRRSSVERRTQSAEYTANNLNQYTAVDAFVPQYDADGNQTLVKTATGTWQVTYNGENRPILWTCLESNNQTNQTISMSFDRMGRRVTKNTQRFVYNGYLQVENFHCSTSNLQPSTFIWDPTEPVATRPLVWNRSGDFAYYVFDGNKNVSEVIDSNNDVSAHYDYAPFGALTDSSGASADANPWRFSSEYAEDDTATVYYNYRHYEPVMGRWMSRDPIKSYESTLLLFCKNTPMVNVDYIGLAAYKWGSDIDNNDCGCCSANETCRWKGFISGNFVSGPFVGFYASMSFMAEGNPVNTKCNKTWFVSGDGDNGLVPGGVFGLGWIKGTAAFDEVIMPCEWPLGDTATGSMTFMGMSAAAGLAISASAVILTVGNFMAIDWFGAGGLHIWIAGGGMVVPDMKVAKRKACNE